MGLKKIELREIPTCVVLRNATLTYVGQRLQKITQHVNSGISSVPPDYNTQCRARLMEGLVGMQISKFSP